MFTEGRIERDTVPKDMFMYEIRHEDGDWGRPCEIAKGILVNHFGTIITTSPLRLPPDGHRMISADDLDFTGGCNNLADFRKKYPPPTDKPPKPKNHDAR